MSADLFSTVARSLCLSTIAFREQTESALEGGSSLKVVHPERVLVH